MIDYQKVTAVEYSRRIQPIRIPLICVLVSLFAVPAVTQSNDTAFNQFLFAKRLLERGETKEAASAFDEYLASYPTDSKRGDALFYRALIAHEAADHTAAAKFLATAPSPEFLPNYAQDLLRGQIHIHLHQYDQALTALEKIHADPLPATLAAFVYHLRGTAYRGSANVPAALTAFDQVSGINSPLRAQAMLEKARLLGQLDRRDDAINTLRTVIDLVQKSPDVTTSIIPEAAMLAAQLCAQIDKNDDAVDFYQLVLEHYHQSLQFAPAVLGMLQSQLASQQNDSVLQTFKQYKEVLDTTDNAIACHLAGSAHQMVGQHEEALALFAIARRQVSSPVHDQTLYKIAVSWYELGQFENTKRALNVLASDHPLSKLNRNGQFLLAAVLTSQNDVHRAVALFTVIINQDHSHPYYADSLYRRAQLYGTGNQLEAALKDYETFLQCGAGKPNQQQTANLQIIDLTYRLGRYETSERIARDFLRIDQDEPSPNPPLIEQEAMYRWGLALIKLNRLGEAVDAFSLLLAQFPQNQFMSDSYYYRGLALMCLDKTNDAIVDLLGAAKSNTLSEEIRANALRVAAVHLRQKGDRQQAADTLNQLRELANLSPDEAIWLAQYWLDHGNEVASLGSVQSLLDSNADIPDNVRAAALFLAGKAQRLIGDPTAAARLFEQVVMLRAGLEIEARLELAGSLQDAVQWEQALQTYALLLNASTTPVDITAEALFSSASIYRDIAKDVASTEPTAAQQANKDARRRFKKLIVLYNRPQLSPLAELSYLEVAEIDAEAGHQDQAVQLLNELAEKFPDTPWATYANALLAVQHRKVGDAVYLLEKLRDEELDPRLERRLHAVLNTLDQSP